MLSELKSGDALITSGGNKVLVRRLKKSRRDTGFEEPIYKLAHMLPTGRLLTGNAEWTLDELQAAGMRVA